MIKNVFLIFIVLLTFSSCDNTTIAGDAQAMPGEIWAASKKVTFKLPALDSLQSYNVHLNLRNTNAYPFSNIFLIAELQHPFGKTTVDTLEYKMANPDGRWLGTGIGNVKENALIYLENFNFKETGNYTLTVSQAVRNNREAQGVSQLVGITDVGYSIEKKLN